jgi:hypothetical protein
MMYPYLSGVASGLAVAAALFFLRYWRRSRDRFFAIWSVSFLLLAAQWAVSAITGSDSHPEAYFLRFVGFVMIVAAIIDKNRGGAGGRRRRAASGVVPVRGKVARGAGEPVA